MTKPYEYYNAEDREDDHVHVEVPYAHLGGEYGHMTRIAAHGVDNIIKDGGWKNGLNWFDTARFIYNWGSGPVVEIVDGKIVEDTR